MPRYSQKIQNEKLPWALHAGAERPRSSFPKRLHGVLRETDIFWLFIDRHTQCQQVKLTFQGQKAVIVKTVHLKTFVGSTPPSRAVVLLWGFSRPSSLQRELFCSPKLGIWVLKLHPWNPEQVRRSGLWDLPTRHQQL